MIYRYPVNYIWISQFYKPNKHFGIDLGWSSKHGGANQPIYAAADGIVYSLKDNDTSGKSWGNYIKIKHSDGTYTLYGHLKSCSLLVKANQKVKQGQQIAQMGNTGDSHGNHLHFEIYKGGAGTKYRVDPLPLTYVFPEQIVAEDTKSVVKYYVPIAKPVERNKEVNQLEVIKDKLRIRKEPNLKADILGFAELGYYNDLETKEADGYIWHKVDESNWLAEVEGYVKLYPKIDFKVGDRVILNKPAQMYVIDRINENEAILMPITDLENLTKI